MNVNRINDYGKMLCDGENLDWKQFTITLHKYTGTKWLEKEHKRSNWWRTSEMNKKWFRIQWLGINTAVAQSNGPNEVESPVTVENKGTTGKLALGALSKGSHQASTQSRHV